MANDELWSDEICALVDAGLFSRNPSDHETAVAYRTAIAAARAQGYAEAKEQAIAWLKADAERCDCAALEERDCACGAWAGYKTVAMTDLIDRFEPAIRIFEREQSNG